MDTTEILSQLQSASSKVKSTKSKLDELQAQVVDASRDNEAAKKEVIDLRKQLNKALDDDLNGIVDTETRGRLSE